MVLWCITIITTFTQYTDRLRYVGQNVAKFGRLSSPLTDPDWTKTVKKWALGSKQKLPQDPSDVITHYKADNAYATYTQIIWDFSYLIGCGYSMFRDDGAVRGRYAQIYVCNYGPA